MQRTPFDIPDQMRHAADKSVGQAKDAISQYLDATQKAIAKAEGSATSIRDGVAEVNRQWLAFVENNLTTSFDFAQKLIQARTIEELSALQQEFVTRQTASLAEQGKGLGEMIARAASQAMDKAKK